MDKKNLFKKFLLIGVFIILAVGIFFSAIKYHVEGEKELPFEIEKILITSTVYGQVVEDTENLWDINISQPNDIFVYIKRKENENTTISNIVLDNFKINTNPAKGNIKILRPTGELEELYKYSLQDYLKDKIEYIGGSIDDLKSLQINNSGGIIGFRVSNEEIGEYVSNDDTEVSYDGKLLNKINTKLEEIKCNISFDLCIKTNDNISYKTTISLDLPVGDIIEEGSSSIEIYNLDTLVFKRV